ncbi:restriction endonuclease subunit S [Vibrio alginolyticus]|uniref:restriction endonuclease subunit S n=1 Tax=Vibrio alginolyticus TaxID=663 RepID=UPI00215DFA4B|nr:restriction endonuclease subunit S [Vibrio alginolyticus]MCS0160437.1 restriction endonuclease subunit S [Vibrio alginolyticus]MCS0207805.1 restriction endonuclease subunit S [Vibrio alginolyticus]
MAVDNLITEHIDIWTSAVKTKSASGRGSSKKLELYGVKKLRELILELAVRGKLVPQDPNDEPASLLLERITAEKARLVKEQKIKKPKQLPAISESEIIEELPKSWELVRIGCMSTLENGDRSKNYPNKSVLVESGIPFVNAGHLVNSRINEAEMTYITQERFDLLRAGKFNDGDILFCLRGSLGKCAIVENFGIGAIASSLVIVKPEKSVIPEYLLKFFESPLSLSNIRKYDNGTAQPNLSASDLAKFVIPLPPLNEQHRIVAKVDELMALCDQLEQQTEASIEAHQVLVTTLLDTLTNSADADELMQNWARISEHFDTLFTTEESIDQLKQTILQLAVMGKLVSQDPNDEPASELLKRIAEEKAQLVKEKKIKKQKALPPISEDEKPFELPSGWEWCHLNSLISEMDAGWSPACPPEASPNHETWGVLKTTAVQNMEYREYENKVLSSSKEPRPQYEVKNGDILITRAGPKNRVGVSCLVQTTRPKLMISDKIIRFHLIELGMSNNFVSLCLNAGATSEYLESSKSGMAESQMNISQDKLKMAPIPLPPIREQTLIAKKVEELIDLCDKLKLSLEKGKHAHFQFTDSVIEQAV